GTQQVCRPPVDRVVHGNHDPGAHLGHDLGRLGRRDGELATGRDQQHVDGAQLSKLLLGEKVTQVSEVTNVHPVDLDGEDDVLPTLRTALAVAEPPDPDDQQVPELVLARSGQGQPGGDGPRVRVVGMLVGNGQQVDVVLARHEAGRRGTRVDDDGRVASPQPAAGAAVPGDLHRLTDANGNARAPVAAQLHRRSKYGGW